MVYFMGYVLPRGKREIRKNLFLCIVCDAQKGKTAVPRDGTDAFSFLWRGDSLQHSSLC
jgi:hypothetical protein